MLRGRPPRRRWPVLLPATCTPGNRPWPAGPASWRPAGPPHPPVRGPLAAKNPGMRTPARGEASRRDRRTTGARRPPRRPWRLGRTVRRPSDPRPHLHEDARWSSCARSGSGGHSGGRAAACSPTRTGTARRTPPRTAAAGRAGRCPDPQTSAHLTRRASRTSVIRREATTPRRRSAAPSGEHHGAPRASGARGTPCADGSDPAVSARRTTCRADRATRPVDPR